MLFSVVTISCNQANFLRRTIDSVLGQQGVEIENIVVDSASTEGSRAIIKEYGRRIALSAVDRDAGCFSRTVGHVD